MLFNSYIFVFVFLPVSLAGYFILNRLEKFKLANCFLILMSLWFYGYFNYSYLPIICLSILINFFISKGITSSGSPAGKKLLLAIGLALNIGSIFYFKYYDFFIENLNKVFGTDYTLKHLILPLGISFFTFQQLSFIIDSYRGEIGEFRLDEYALYVSYFPQLIAGPIVLHSEMLPQIRSRGKRRFNSKNAAEGLYTFAIGLAKKVLIADSLSALVTAGFSDVGVLSCADLWLVSVCYTFQIYFDFSGYSDMAIGLGRLFNFDLPQNFNSPYRSTSITEFWARWHMTLTRFLRTYIYFPLGGSRKGKLRTYINIMTVFLASGIWHGANWTFIVWGLLHGVFNCLERVFKKSWEKLHVITRWIVNFILVNTLWIFFRADSVGEALWVIKKMLSLDAGNLSKTLLDKLSSPFLILPFSIPGINSVAYSMYNFKMWFILLLCFVIILEFKNSGERSFKPTVGTAIVTVACLSLSIMNFAGVTEFLYFNF